VPSACPHPAGSCGPARAPTGSGTAS